MTISQKLNGKKRYVVGGAGGLLGLGFLIPFLIGLNGTVEANVVRAEDNKTQIEKLSKVPAHIATIKADMRNLKENVDKMYVKQEKYQDEQRQANHDILDAIAGR